MVSYSELFPTYPWRLYTPQKSSIRIGSRKLYVDFPYILYHFVSDILYRYRKTFLTKQQFENEWKSFLSKRGSEISFNDKLLAKVQLVTSHSFTTRPFLIVRINWNLFLKYLEQKVEVCNLMENGGRNISKIYRDIYCNYYNLIRTNYTESSYSTHLLEDFKKFLEITGESKQIRYYLESLKILIEKIKEKFKNSYPHLFFISQLEIEWYHLSDSFFQIVDIPSCYFYLRTILEHLVKFFIYLEIVKSFDDKSGLALMILYFSERCKNEKENKYYSLTHYKKLLFRKMVKLLRTINNEEEITLEILKGIPILGIKKNVIDDFCKEKGVSNKLTNLWIACSEIIHNQPPLPFYSLLEIKTFKHFLRLYVNEISSFVVQILGGNFELFKKDQLKEIKIKRGWLSKEATYILEFFETKRSEKVEEIIERTIKNNLKKENELSFDPVALFSLFYLKGVSHTKAKKMMFTKEDIDYFATRIKPLSFLIGLEERINATLLKFEESLLPQLKKLHPKFSKLSKEEQRSLIFHLLYHFLLECTHKNLLAKVYD